MRRISLAMVLGLCLAGLAGQAQAADTDTITVTVSLESIISVSVAPNTWTIGALSLGGSSGPSAFTATIGNVATKLEIMGANAAGGWTIGATAGADRFSVAVTAPALTLTTAYQTLAASVAPYGNQPFGLTYSAPTSDTNGGGVDQGFTITLKASAA